MTITRHAYAITTLVIVLTGVSVSSTKFKSQPPASQNVVVTNDAAHAMPVSLAAGTSVGINGTPTVMVQGTPTVNIAANQTVGIAGTPYVNIANASDIKMSSTTVAPVQTHPVSETLSNHISVTYSVTMTDGEYTGDATFNVPPGKAFVLKDISIRSVLPAGDSIIKAYIQGTSDGYLFMPTIPMQLTATTKGNNYRCYTGQSIGCSYVFEEGDVKFYINRDSANDTGGADVSISGYLEDAN